jgi:hypothetical protein
VTRPAIGLRCKQERVLRVWRGEPAWDENAQMTITKLILAAMAIVVLYWGVRILLGRRS